MNTLDMLRQMIGSKTVWGVLILVLNLLVFKDAPLSDAVGQEIADTLTGVITAFGAVIALWGRLTAKGPLISPSVT